MTRKYLKKWQQLINRPLLQNRIHKPITLNRILPDLKSWQKQNDHLFPRVKIVPYSTTKQESILGNNSQTRSKKKSHQPAVRISWVGEGWDGIPWYLESGAGAFPTSYTTGQVRYNRNNAPSRKTKRGYLTSCHCNLAQFAVSARHIYKCQIKLKKVFKKWIRRTKRNKSVKFVESDLNSRKRKD